MKKIHQLPVIKRLHSDLKDLRDLSTLLKNCLQEEWGTHCEIVRIDPQQKKIVLSTSEQSLLLHLRFMQENLLKQLKKKSPPLRDITHIECIYTPLTTRFSKTKSLPLLSKSSVSVCESAATQCQTSLKKSLLKLSKTLQERIHT